MEQVSKVPAMKKTILLAAALWIAIATVLGAADSSVDLLAGMDPGGAETSDATLTATQEGTLVIATGTQAQWPGVTLRPSGGRWDLSDRLLVEMRIRNRGTGTLTVNLRVDNPGADGREHCATGSGQIEGGRQAVVRTQLFPSQWRLSAPLEVIGMRGNPTHESRLDASNVTALVVFINQPKVRHEFEVLSIRAMGHVHTIDAKNFYPFIDEFGQFIHGDWPGKTHSVEELQAVATAEAAELAAQPGPTDRNPYGGWTKGPTLEATGLFRVQKHNGKWWLVDPEGRLFWSHGTDCVNAGSATPISDRENYFKDLPGSNSAFAQFYDTGTWAPHGYYKDHSPYKTYDFARANLLRKYGRDWSTAFADVTHRRLASWGMNTIANWSDASIYRMRRTPYTATISFGSRVIEGSQGYWGKFFDVFDESFRAAARRAIAGQKALSMGDPWCIGYFVHNELGWGDETSLAVAALTSPAEQPAKHAFMEDLKAKYGSVEKLNSAWGTSHASWEALLQATAEPDKTKAGEDLKAFYTRIAETYFRIISEELREAAPKQIYMGCRFAWVNDRAVRAAAKYCDIVSFNRYNYSVADQGLPEGLDKPIVIGEFHFGALDRGMFHTGLKVTSSQQDRAAAYADYVRGALRNRYIVGTHWFQYKDQATTGRGDGENYQIGLVDICDRPYPETIQAVRDVGYGMYEYRMAE